jgi:hypothetical protein
MSFAEAQSKIVKALELREAVRSLDQGAAAYGERQRLRKELTEDLAARAAADRDSTARRLLGMSALDAYLDRWFRTKKADRKD